MKCIIPGINVKVFGRAIHSLAKIGDELYFEPLDHGLALRTVNSSRSAYACFHFAPCFFEHYTNNASNGTTSTGTCSTDDDDLLRCKIVMKSCLTIFKSLSTIEKTVDRCKITLNMKDARLVFQLYCRHGILKTHNLTFIECETLQAVFSKELSPNVLTAQSRLLCDVGINFQTSQEEVTLKVSPQLVSFKNYVEDEPDPNKVIHTEVNLAPDEFDGFRVGVDTEVTFCLKELRALLSFSESGNIPVTVSFVGPSKPIVLSLDSDSTYEANFVLATLAEPTASQQKKSVNASHQRTPAHNNQSVNKRTMSVNKSRQKTTNSSRPIKIAHHKEKQPPAKPDRSGSGDFEINNDLQLLMDEEWDEPVRPSERVGPSEPVRPSERVRPSEPVKPSERVRPSESVRPSTSSKPSVSKQDKVPVSSPIQLDDDNDEEDVEDDVIPGTPPPAKKFCSLFGSLSQRTSSQISQQTAKVQILAEDTDDDD